MTKYAAGQANRFAINTHFVNCFESRKTIPDSEAPNTLRIPISLVRRSVKNDARPKRPRQEMTMANSVKAFKIVPIFFSFLYKLSYF